MPPKKVPKANAGKKLNTEQEALQRANAVDDNYDEENRRAMRYECRALQRYIEKTI